MAEIRKWDKLLSTKDVSNEKRLTEAAQNRNIKEIERLLDAGVSPDASELNRQLFYQSEYYLTPLHHATHRGYDDVVNLLIKRGANVNACDRFDVCPLHTAAELGHEECLVHLLDGGADCNSSTKFSKHGSYTAVPHAGGTTPLHLAAFNNHIGCVKQLIWNGADYNAVDERGRTSLYLAAEQGYSDCVHAHLDNAIWKDILSLPEKFTGNTPLHECVKKNMLDCIEKLLERGSDVNHLNHLGLSPLHLSVMAGENYQLDTVKLLITKGYKPNVNLCEKKCSFTPLHYACFTDTVSQERRPELAELLLAYGADHNIRNKRGFCLIVSELRGGHSDRTILSAIYRCVIHLPSLDVLGHANLVGDSLLMRGGLAGAGIFGGMGHAGNIQDLRQHHLTLARHWAENQREKLNWYRQLLQGPRTLQHYCRCVIRECIGAKKLVKVPELPLPLTMKEFLLLQHG
ncbi:serine/threonine-protein phosphatase 6 regulatory ankyrin repeat subunit C-like [Mya arenaria]|uniref:serine/threonine-protein phosphatase 6 regulatory ankyrin repeat subunit C-like n=1 Tax=Mya arenaria TaxID=6604 RepID=UPI0022E17129|nr:serine/threonine-protein phosphatase 6 regulatory ankyrin repeat subunit C-like [Mya arenaria]